MKRQTLFCRLARTEQVDELNKTIKWDASLEAKWGTAYGKLNVGDLGVFIGKDKVYIGYLHEININVSLTFNNIESYFISNDDFLRLNAIEPENNSTMKANFQPFVAKNFVDDEILKTEIKNRNYISFYIINNYDLINEKLYPFNNNDRIVTMNNGKLNFLNLFQNGSLTSFKNFKADLFGSKDFSLSEIKSIHKQKDKGNNIEAINRIEKGINQNSIYKFKSFNEYYNIIHNKSIYRNINDENSLENELENIHHNSKVISNLNTILYGPPGTGKTFNTINTALKIINGKDEQNLNWNDRVEVKKQYEKRIQEGRIVFTTFHQSLSYEDFIEGIKPQKPDEKSETLQYDVEAGLFKSFCSLARTVKIVDKNINWDTPNYYKMSIGGKNRPDLHEWCIANNVIGLGWGGQKDLSKYSDIKDWSNYRDLFTKENPDIVKESRFNVQATYAFMNMKLNDIVVVSKGNHIIDAIGIIKGPYYFEDENPIEFLHYRKVEWLATGLNLNPEKFFKKQISQMTIYEFYSDDVKKDAFKEISNKELSEETKPFVFIIDEINRGNVSQIFGELITLIEEDKREGKNEALEVTLPYSKEKFSVPSNLYILGTMNTADRSVEALDTALRRRFSFIEMMPDYNTINNEISNIKLSDLLFTINKRLAYLINEDHQIGHSYFISVDNEDKLRTVFKNNIIPLLKEYFYNDVSKIQLVLGEGFVTNDKTNKPNFAVSNQDIIDRDVYKLKIIDDDFNIIEALTKLKIEAIA